MISEKDFVFMLTQHKRIFKLKTVKNAEIIASKKMSVKFEEICDSINRLCDNIKKACDNLWMKGSGGDE